jgi:hypothetical protein
MSPDLKKNPAENYMAPDPANFLHQLPQKESSGKLCSSRSRNFLHQHPQKFKGSVAANSDITILWILAAM